MYDSERVWNIALAVSKVVRLFAPLAKSNVYVTRIDREQRDVLRINRINQLDADVVKAIKETIEANFCESLEYRKTLKTYMDFYLD